MQIISKRLNAYNHFYELKKERPLNICTISFLNIPTSEIYASQYFSEGIFNYRSNYGLRQ